MDVLRRAAVSGRQPICFDSAPLIDYVALQEPVATLLRPLLETADVPVVISAISLAEVVIRPAMAADHARVAAIHRALIAVPSLTIVEFDPRHAIEAALVRGLTGLRLPDAAVIATARLAGAGELVGNDRRWRAKPLGVPYHHLDDILALP
jgi:predicted nucleic acid-binding protein